MFTIEVEFLTGVSVAASPYRREEGEWPPHPDRLFQALVAAYGRNDPPDGEERSALEWLESLDAGGLLVSAPTARPRDVATVFVPPNDARTAGNAGDKVPKDVTDAIRVVPEFRKNRQPRAFPAFILDLPDPTTDGSSSDRMPVVHYLWCDAPGREKHRDALARLVREVTYLGHSHSLVRVGLVDHGGTDAIVDSGWIGPEGIDLRLPYRGRLRHLEDQYQRSHAASHAVRPNPSLVMRAFQPSEEIRPMQTLFDGRNITVFADAGGFCPSLTAFPLVAKRLRDALLKVADSNDIPIPALLSGHNADNRPTSEPHLAIVPLADVGWSYSQGRLMGLALVWPRDTEDDAHCRTLRVLAAFLRDGIGSVGLLHFGRDGSWQLSLAPEPDRASLQFTRYVRPARRWGTVLPAVLDRHPKDKPGQDLPAIIVRACRNVGLPDSAVDGLEVEIHKHAPVKGAPSARDVAKALPGDSPYRNRPLAHLALNFRHPIRGPLILGAGRFRGLGLCLPIDEGPSS